MGWRGPWGRFAGSLTGATDVPDTNELIDEGNAAERIGLLDRAESCFSQAAASDDPMLQVALELEKIALHDQYFIDRKLYPNVDFYSGITLKAMGFPMSMFTVLFAVARTVGWISQWSEMIEDPQQKIGRPRQLYTGVARRDYVEISKRK